MAELAAPGARSVDGDAGPPFDAGPPGPIDAGCTIHCGTAPCPVRSGQPRVILTSPFDQQIGAIAVSGDTLYWGTYPNQTVGEIRSMPLTGGPSTLLVSNVIIQTLLLDGATLYYVSTDRAGMSTLGAIPTTGGTPKVLETARDIGYLAANGSTIYFDEGGTGFTRIMRVDSSNGSVTQVLLSPGAGKGFAIDDTYVYWTLYLNNGLLQRTPFGGSNTHAFRSSLAPITSPLLDGDDLDFVEGTATPDTCRSTILSVPKSPGGEAPTVVSPGTSGIDVMELVRDETHLYWASSGVHGAVLRTVKGQTPEIIAPDQFGATQVRLGPKDVYWISRAGTTYEVRTVPK